MKKDDKDYSKSLLLPQTDFPMRASLPEKELQMIDHWNKMDLWKKLRENSKDKEKFILHDGPPYANGAIHIGTALNKILKDIINRSKQMEGYNSHYIPGWDCHGLPIEWKIEQNYRKKGISKEQVGIQSFRTECREFADHWIEAQMNDFKRLFILGDWDNRYLTMSYKAEAQIVREIGKFLIDGSLYRGIKPVMWSPVEQTALAEAEVEYKTIKSDAVFVRFPIVSSEKSSIIDADAVIWTTTPWTIPGNRAIAYGKDIEYALYEIKDAKKNTFSKKQNRILIASKLSETVKAKCGINEWKKLLTVRGSELKGTECLHPLNTHGYDHKVTMHEGDFVGIDQGSGLVHIAPAHGEDDYYLGLSVGLEIPDIIDDRGIYKKQVPLFAGQHVFKVGRLIIDRITNSKNLLGEEEYHHSYPHSWRSKQPVIFRTTPQWFISMDKTNLRKNSLRAIENTKWMPENSKNRISSMVRGRPDWCVSRQRAWGVPITVFLNKKTGEPLRDQSVINRVATAVEEEGADAWFSRNSSDFLGDSFDPDAFEKVEDILDVWFDSGSTHSFVLENNPSQKWPADLYLEGTDQHRGWFHSSLLESCGTRGRAPYNAVLTHGFVLASDGHKMSKSIGNVVLPQDIISKSGADILRLWVAMSDYSEDVRIGNDIISGLTDSYRRLRNTMRFLLGNLNDFQKSEIISYTKMPELEKWILHNVFLLEELRVQTFSEFSFQLFYKSLHDFCASDLSAFYFDVRKDSLYCDKRDSDIRRSTRTVLYNLYNCITAWLAPVLCYTSEEAWLEKNKEEESIHLKLFPKIPNEWENKELEENWEIYRKLRKCVNTALEIQRKNKVLRSSLEAKVQIYTSNNKIQQLLYKTDLAELFIVSQCEVVDDTSKLDKEGLFYKEEQLFKDLQIVTTTAKGDKCSRCWKILQEVGNWKEFSDLCGRCYKIIK